MNKLFRKACGSVTIILGVALLVVFIQQLLRPDAEFRRNYVGHCIGFGVMIPAFVVAGWKYARAADRAKASTQAPELVKLGRRLAWISEDDEDDDPIREEDGWPVERGRILLARVGAEGVCREGVRFSIVRIGQIRMNGESFTVAIEPISTPGLWNSDSPWSFGGIWDDNHLSLGRDNWVSNHLSLHIRFDEELLRGLVAVAANLPAESYTEHHAAVASSYIGLFSAEARRTGQEIAALLGRMRREGANRSDAYSQAWALIPVIPEKVDLEDTREMNARIARSLLDWCPSDESAEANRRFLDTARLMELTQEMLRLLFPVE